MAELFFGAWKLDSVELEMGDGKVIKPMGEHPSGQIHYDPSGKMIVLGFRNWVEEPRPKGATVCPESFDAFGYHGTYEVLLDKKIILHHALFAADPPFIGDRERKFSFSDDKKHLKLSGITSEGRTINIYWSRF